MRTVFDISRNESGLVDRYIGTAFDIVHHVHDNLKYIKQTSFYMESLVNLDNHMAQIAALQGSLLQLLVVYDNLPMLTTLMADVNAYMKALSDYKQTLAGTNGAGNIGTAGNNTVQEALDKLAQRLDTTEGDWENYDQLFKNLQSNASYHAVSKATATSLAQTLKNGDLVFVHEDESLEGAATIYSVAGAATKTLTLVHDFDAFSNDLAGDTGSGLIGHTNADGTKTTVGAKLNAMTAGMESVKQTADAAATKDALATVKQTADAAATKDALATVKQTADAAAPASDLTALAQRVQALEDSAAGGGTA